MGKKKSLKQIAKEVREMSSASDGAVFFPTTPEPEGKRTVRFRKRQMSLRQWLETLPEDDELRVGFEELFTGNEIAEAMMSDYTRIIEEEILNPGEYELKLTCGACPEQYEVFREGKQVGYLRLRHGFFRVDCPDCGGETVYTACTKGDGLFDEDERDGYLSAALEAIDKWCRESEE